MALEEKYVIEAALLSSDEPLKVQDLMSLFEGISSAQVKILIDQLNAEYKNRCIEIVEVSSGYRISTKKEVNEILIPLWELKPQKLSRAMYETIALIAYRQPITRGEIEEIREVSVSANIIKNLFEKEWIKVVGHKDTLGKPALLATTAKFLDSFNLKKISDLPPLEEIEEMFTSYDSETESESIETKDHSAHQVH